MAKKENYSHFGQTRRNILYVLKGQNMLHEYVVTTWASNTPIVYNCAALLHTLNMSIEYILNGFGFGFDSTLFKSIICRAVDKHFEHLSVGTLAEVFITPFAGSKAAYVAKK